MKKTEISSYMFNKAIESVKGNLATNDSRPILKFIKVEVDEKFINFISLNGYAMTIYKFEHKNENVIPFEFVFKGFKVFVDKNLQYKVSIELLENNILKINYIDKEDYKVEKVFNQAMGEYINWKKILTDNKDEENISISFNKNFLLNSLKSHKADTVTLKISATDKALDNYFSTTKLKPIFINSTGLLGEQTETMVLPVRTFNKEEN